MTDEERLIQAVQRAATKTNSGGRLLHLNYTESLIANLRNEQVGLTPPPAPEPTYHIQFSDKQRATWMTEFAMHDPPVFESHPLHSLWLAITEATPDESPTE